MASNRGYLVMESHQFKYGSLGMMRSAREWYLNVQLRNWIIWEI
jgi:hypothetical protein